MKQLISIVLFLMLAASASGQTQRGNTYIAPWDVPALEEPYFFEPYFDTIYVHDTVYISNADAFLKKYYEGKITLNELVKNQQMLDSILRQLGRVSGKELYFNFFGNHRFSKGLAQNIVLTKYTLTKTSLDGDSVFWFKTPITKSDNFPDSTNSERALLFLFTGVNRTNRFLNNQEAITRAIFYMITEIQANEERINAINLYFPDFNFKEKRAMAQFIKSVRMVLDAAEDKAISNLKIKVFFQEPDNASVLGEDFLYSLCIQANDVILLDPINVEYDYYVVAKQFTQDDFDDIGLFSWMKAHYYLARYSPEDTLPYSEPIEKFTKSSIRKIVHGDIPENDWEYYLWFFCSLFLLMVLIISLYFIYPPFAYLLNANMGIVLTSAVIFCIELLILFGVIFQNMSTETEEVSSDDDPTFILMMPILMVVVLPLIRQLTRNKRLP